MLLLSHEVLPPHGRVLALRALTPLRGFPLKPALPLPRLLESHLARKAASAARLLLLLLMQLLELLILLLLLRGLLLAQDLLLLRKKPLQLALQQVERRGAEGRKTGSLRRKSLFSAEASAITALPSPLTMLLRQACSCGAHLQGGSSRDGMPESTASTSKRSSMGAPFPRRCCRRRRHGWGHAGRQVR